VVTGTGSWVADFRRLYDFTEAGRDDLKVPADDFNVAKRLDTLLVNPLHQLPLVSFGGNNAAVRATGRELNLAFRLGLQPLDAGQIITGSGGASLTKEVWARSGAWPPRAQTGEGREISALSMTIMPLDS
jgi:hypothetical protein